MATQEELTGGTYLRQMREQKGLTLDKASQDSKIIKKILQALEQEDYQNLPPSPYLEGLIKDYARYLRLNEEKVLALYLKNKKNSTTSDASFSHKESVKSVLPFSQIVAHFLQFFLLGLFLVYCGWELSQFLLPAKITLFTPTPNFVASNPDLEIKGQVKRAKSLFLQGQEIRFDQRGFFQEQLRLVEGLNTLELKAFNPLGKETTLEQQVFFSSPVNSF